MLTFDHTCSRFLLDGIAIGPGVTAQQLANSLPAEVEPMPNNPAWSFIRVDDRPVNAFVTFLDGKVHSGYFWIDVPGSGWEDYERTEQERRARHEHLMNEIFGSVRFEDHAICIELVRDPRSGLEQINFEVR
jgi:hypothetical protein